MSPSDAGFQDRYIVQEVIKEMAKNRPIDTKGKKGFKAQRLLYELLRKLDAELKHEVCHWAAYYASILYTKIAFPPKMDSPNASLAPNNSKTIPSLLFPNFTINSLLPSPFPLPVESKRWKKFSDLGVYCGCGFGCGCKGTELRDTVCIFYLVLRALDTVDDLPGFSENDSSFCVDITSTKDGKFITVNSNSRTSSEVYVIDSVNPSNGLQKICNRTSGVQYFVEHHSGLFYILTNAPIPATEWSGQGYYLVRCRVEDVESAKFQDVILPDKDTSLCDMDILNGYLVLFFDKKDFALAVSSELESLRLKTVNYFVTRRPWLDLYGVNVRPVAPFGSASRRLYVDPALIHRSLPDELLFEVFARMTAYDLGKASCVCRKWKYTIRNPVFWRNACLKAWQVSGIVENYKILQSKYDGSWRKMWLLRPRLRTDGLYVSRNTYIRVGVAEWKVTNPVHMVCYFRYMRFFPSGRFLYKNSSQKIKDVAKCMNFRSSKADCVFGGHYTLTDDKVEAAVLYPGMRPTVLRIRLRIRGTTTGANNRMDLISLVTSGVNSSEASAAEEDILGVVEGWQDDETHNSDVPAVSHKRGMTPFVFVPFEEVETSVLNLPVEKMDYFVPG